MNLQHERIGELCEQMRFARLGTDWQAVAQKAAATEASFVLGR